MSVYREGDRQTDRQTDRQADRQIDRQRETDRERGREEEGRRRWVVHDEKRKGKTFVEGLKEEEYCSRNEEETDGGFSREKPGPEMLRRGPTVMSFSGGSKC